MTPKPPTARVVYSSLDGETIEVGGHRIDFGGPGDGYCYGHQSFHCLADLSDAEWEAIRNA